MIQLTLARGWTTVNDDAGANVPLYAPSPSRPMRNLGPNLHSMAGSMPREPELSLFGAARPHRPDDGHAMFRWAVSESCRGPLQERHHLTHQ
jgi:hypothetical protein